MHPINCRCVRCLVDRSSLGTPEAKALRESVPPEAATKALLIAKELDFIKWLVETLHYPFDLNFDPPPPVDHDRLADYWNEWDGWDLPAREARACIREEARGLIDRADARQSHRTAPRTPATPSGGAPRPSGGPESATGAEWCGNPHGPDGIIACWNPGGPCLDSQTVCECCGPCGDCRPGEHPLDRS